MQQRTVVSVIGVLALLLPLLSGCGKMQVASEVKPDGSLTRTLIFKEAGPPDPDGPPSASNPMAAMGMGNKLDDILILPRSPEWTISREMRKNEVVITATRTIPAGGTIQDDIGVRKDTPEGANPFGGPMDETPAPPPKPAPKPVTPKKKPTPKPAPKKPGNRKPDASGSFQLARSLQPMPLYCAPQPPPDETAKPPVPLLSNTVTVREIAPGKLEYREVIRFREAPPKNLTDPDPAMMGDIRKLLPPNLASDDKAIRAVTTDMQKAIWRLIFGPGDPIFTTLFANSDLAEYRLKTRLVHALDTSLKTHYAGRLSDAERTALVSKMAEDIGETGMTKSQSASAKQPGSDASLDGMGAPVSLFMRVKMPGKVISTNGDLDPVTGEVTWVMYTWAAALGEIELVTVCEKP